MTMNMKICAKGHFYDGDTNHTCPMCAAEGQNAGGYGATEPVGGSFGGGFEQQAGATEPIGGGMFGNGFDHIGETQPIGGGSMDTGGMTGTKAPTQGFGGGGETMRFVDSSVPGVDNYNDQTMPHNPGMVAGFTPVVGWLVCIEGPDRGSDYRIRSGYNHIGRAEHMDICIRGDKQISREKHALIAYDDTEKIFFFGPSDGRNIVRVNGKMVMVPTELHPYDIVTIGTSRMIFIPLCGEKFNWSE
ncbi:FHA domain-containing protein [bacterium D16-54]|nr:FHA domain-containing protein [bacterium D16-54]RKJ16924.1 FHA domain-containing protein [bacterium D16-56]